jgi:hypothetical protein
MCWLIAHISLSLEESVVSGSERVGVCRSERLRGMEGSGEAGTISQYI